jgi:hypothetical protein
MRICPTFILALILFVAVSPAVADNNVTIIEPYASAGSYGTGEGQIDTPLSVKVDADDNIYVLQQVHTNGARLRSVITIYSKNLTFLRSFDILKTSMVDTGWDQAWSNFYYDDIASEFYIDGEGTIYVLCGWDVVVMDNYGRYMYQFPVSSFMGWIDNIGGDTQFYYPHGLVITEDGYVVTTSGSSPTKHEMIFIYPDGKLFTKIDIPAEDIYNIAMDRDGRLYVIEAGNNVVRSYDPSMTNEIDMSLYFDGYDGSPASLAFFSNGNFSASANGIIIYDSNGSVRDHFADNKLSENTNWGRPITTNSEDCLIVVSGIEDAGKTPKPIMLYKYVTGQIYGAGGRFDSPLNMIGLAVLALLAIIWVIGALYIIKK